MRVAAVNIRLDVHASSERISEAYVEGSANGHHRSTNILRLEMSLHLHICAFCPRCSYLNLPKRSHILSQLRFTDFAHSIFDVTPTSLIPTSNITLFFASCTNSNLTLTL